ncbi:MAG: hypothetical protein GF411_08725 [Candidatus Lokiarchaeota archaeon]|nr:hypothetical protein [Candidatus Lokiarchaeota archaeon]
MVRTKDYMLTIRIPLSGVDDFDAREKCKEIVSNMEWSCEKQVKLQEIFKNKEPRGVRL